MAPAKFSGAKKKDKSVPSNKRKSTRGSKNDESVETKEEKQNNCDDGNTGPRKMPRRQAACSNFKEKSVRLVEKNSVIQNKQEERVVEEESEVLCQTMTGPEQRPCRKILDFVLHDSDGNPQPFEMSEIDDTYITALVTPMDEDLVKAREKGVRCEGFGRIESWSISGYDDGVPVIWVITEIADYECVKPSSNYKKFFDRFQEKANVCVEVYKILAKSRGGDPNLSLEELLARVVRAMSGNKGFPAGVSGLDFVISLGEFIFNQLAGLDVDPETGDDNFSSLHVLVSLKEQCQNRGKDVKHFPNGSSKTLSISDEKPTEVTEDEDEKLARLLQEEEEWKVLKQRDRQSAAANKFYIKITEDEIANDYPLPAYYKPAVQEMDEYVFFDSDGVACYSDALPTRILDNWSLYNSDSRLISLELLPMKPCAEVDVMIFGSGNMREDDGTGFCLDDADLCQSSSSSGAVIEGVPVYLSAIKEWMIEFGSSMVFISVRTAMAWYRLGKPAKQYAPWYGPILKTARLAISIISLLKEQSRASRISFSDAIKKVAEFEKTHAAYISSNVAEVERYVVVHGQIILQQFAEYPDEIIRRCAFITGLSEKMELRHHTKLLLRKKVAVQKGANMNPSASMEPIQSKRKVMRATTTRLINRIWGEYYSTYMPEDSKEDPGLDPKEEEEIEEQEENEDEDADVDEEKVICDNETPKSRSITRSQRAKVDCNGIEWRGVSSGKMSTGEILYRSASVRGSVVTVGGVVMVDSDELEEGDVVYIEYMFENSSGIKMLHGRTMKKGSQTVLGNAANEMELFLTNECSDFELADVRETVPVEIRRITWGYKYRKECDNAHKIDKAKINERKKKGLPMEYFCKSLYWPQKGAFFSLPFNTIGLGTGCCHSCKLRQSNNEELTVDFAKSSFVYKSTKYNVDDFVYVRPDHFGEIIVDNERFKAGRNVGLKAFVVCQVIALEASKRSEKPTPESMKIKVRRFYRPEDISSEKAYRSDIRELYYSEDTSSIPVEMIEGKCEIRRKNQIPDSELPICNPIFFCELSYDPVKGSFKELPANFKIRFSEGTKVNGSISRKNKGKCKEGEKDDFVKWKNIPPENRLTTLDIFAGCGGLSEGLQQSGVSYTKWAIEYEQPAGEAFSENHPDAVMFIDNCNVILRAIMEKCGDVDDCVSTAEATDLAASLGEEKVKNLPLPGQVDFINGGPPCQGFSGMNRFSHGIWSKVQCEMILAFLSYADYFRPRFFLLENVRTFVSFNKGQTFRLTLASLLEMGYQVRFGILEAGSYGVSQSRKRAFIWAASPDETLPEWPEPMHVFAGPELKVSLTSDLHYAAVRSTAGGAPFRSITVRDTIGDLPSVVNGASRSEIEYGLEPVSWFQKQIRGNMMVLSDHISKEMNELNLIRCQHIPKKPGADWRDLPEKKVKLSTGQMVDLIPWCLPNTAKRHNQWKGLFGRLDWDGNFPTSITDPQPMGKVGMCFHPDQDRILTVRECARSQGFPDSYRFSGNIQNKHRQIGNAVPPPLAYALGMKLKEVIDTKGQTSLKPE